MELHLDAPVLVRPNLLARLPRDNRRLHARDDGPRRHARRAEGRVHGIGLEGVRVALLRGGVRDGAQDVSRVGVAAVVLFEVELVAGGEGADVPLAAQGLLRVLVRLKPDVRARLARVLLEEAARILVDAHVALARGLDLEVGRGRLEVEVVVRELPRHHLLLDAQARDGVVVRVLD